MSLDVLSEHAWAAGEAQVVSQDYELNILPVAGTPPAHRNPPVGDDFRLGMNLIANGGPPSPRRDGSTIGDS